MLVFAPLAFGATRMWAFLVVQGLAAAVPILWIARLWLSRKPKLLWPPLAWAVVAFTLYAVARYFTADIEYVARLEVIKVLVFALIFFTAVNHLHGQEETSAVSFTLITLGALLAGWAVAQLAHHSTQVWNVTSPNPGRASGTYISPNHLAGLLAMLLPLALAYLLVAKVSILSRILLGYAVAVMMAGLAVTFSRGGWMAGAAGVLLVLGVLLGHRNHRLWAALLLVGLLVGGVFFTSQFLSKTLGYMQRVEKPAGEGAGGLKEVVDFDTRLQMWGAAARMWRDYFWWGVGPAHYDVRFREYRPESFQKRPELAHNDYLNLLADWGAVGGIIVFTGIGIFMVGVVHTWPHVRREENDFGSGRSNRFAFFLGATGGLAALTVHSTTDFNLHIPANALVGVTLLGLVASNVRFATERHWLRAGRSGKMILTILLGAVAIYFFLEDWRLSRETHWLALADRAPQSSPARMAALEKAFAAEPRNFQTAYDLGECYRIQSFEHLNNYPALARQAMDWYALAIQNNPWFGYAFLRTGMCLDWLEQPAAAEKFYHEAERCDPNGYFMLANIGWHYIQTGDYAAGRQWFLRSLRLDANNAIARNYLEICDTKLLEKP